MLAVAAGTGTLSDGQGQYRVSLPAGRYDLIVSRVGSRTTRFDGITVSAGQTTTFDSSHNFITTFSIYNIKGLINYHLQYRSSKIFV